MTLPHEAQCLPAPPAPRCTFSGPVHESRPVGANPEHAERIDREHKARVDEWARSYRRCTCDGLTQHRGGLTRCFCGDKP